MKNLQVRVNSELILNAGTCEEVPGPHGPERLIHPPPTTLFHQALEYLQAKPDPPMLPRGSAVGREGLAAAALTLRWGSYLAVLLDRGKTLWDQAGSVGTSCISDSEMARINIEASAALSEWIDLYRQESMGGCYEQLVNRAVSYLPMPNQAPKLKANKFVALSDPGVAKRVIHDAGAALLERTRANTEKYPTRVFANTLMNTAWRNGPVDDIHAGRFRGYPLDRRRITPREEHKLMAYTSEGLALGMSVCLAFATEQSKRSWSEQVLPYGLVEILQATPSKLIIVGSSSQWTLVESSREVRLPAEPDLSPGKNDE